MTVNSERPRGRDVLEFDPHAQRFVAQSARARRLDRCERRDHFQHDIALRTQLFEYLIERFSRVARGIDAHGALLVETPGGVQRFISGEVSVRIER